MKAARTGPEGPVAFVLLAGVLAFAPLLRGGNRPLPLALLEAAAVAMLLLVALAIARGAWRPSLPRSLWIALGLLLGVPLLQLVPLPAAWWAALPGHAPYVPALEFAGESALAAMRPASVHPRATEFAWLATLPGVAVFLLVLAQPRSRLRTLATVFACVAAAEAVLGMMQVRAGKDSWVHLGNAFGGGASTGTYVNKNHFAALMAMALPVSVALWALEALPPRMAAGGGRGPHGRHADRRTAAIFALSILVLVIGVGLLLSGSRGGIGSGLLAAALASLALVWRSGPLLVRAAFAATAAAGLALAAYAGLTPVLDRFAAGNLALGAAGRAELTAASWRAALDFLPFGSGLGTFADVFRRHQTPALPGFIDHAHNDYVELLVELGIAGAAIVALALAAYAMAWSRLLREKPARTLGYLQVGAGLGLLALLVHAAFDFNFHIPANALYFGFLAGIFFFTPDADRA